MIIEANLQDIVKGLTYNTIVRFKRSTDQGQLYSINLLIPYFNIEVIRYIHPLDVLHPSAYSKGIDQEMLALYQRAILAEEIVLVPKNNTIYILVPR